MAIGREIFPLIVATFAFNVALRTLPLAAYAWTGARDRPLWVRAIVTTLALAALGLAASGVNDPKALVGALAAAAIYFFAAAWLTHIVRLQRIAQLIDPVSLLAACVAVYLVFPSVMLRAWLSTPIVVLGFDFALSAYSYLVSKPAEPRSMRDGIVFILVDPQLVYKRRSVPFPPGVERRGWWRCAASLVVLALAEIVALRLTDTSRALATLASQSHYPNLFALVWPVLLLQYMSLAGSASLQIGVLQLLGLQVEERFRYPLLAHSPSDFWQRWNRYGSEWFRIHVFGPVAGSRLSRRLRLNPVAAWAFAVLAVFAINGALHVVTMQLLYQRIDARPLLGFLGFGVLIIGFDFIRRAARFDGWGERHAWVARFTGILLTLHIVLLLGWFLLPADALG